jgi:hypothetical protein
MDDMVLLVKHQCPLRLIADTVRVAAIFNRTAAEFGFVVQYGVGKTEAVIVLRGRNRMAAIKVLIVGVCCCAVAQTVPCPAAKACNPVLQPLAESC